MSVLTGSESKETVLKEVTSKNTMPACYQGWVWRGGESASALQLETIATDELDAQSVWIRNEAIGLNPVDWKVLPNQLGQVPGVDGAGVVVAVGADVDSGWIGKRVAYHQDLQRAGSFAEYTPVRARSLIQLPEAVDMVTAASVPCPALTAWLALEKIPVKGGRDVLISGAGGSVGHYLVQFACQRHFNVTAMCHPRHWASLQKLGAMRCLESPLSGGLTWPEEAHRYFAVIDSLNAQHAEKLSPALLANGHLVCIQGRTEHWPDTPFGPAWSLHEVALGALHHYGNDAQWQELTRTGHLILQGLVTGTLVPETLLVEPFEQLPIQLDRLQHRNFSGKLVIQVS